MDYKNLASVLRCYYRGESGGSEEHGIEQIIIRQKMLACLKELLDSRTLVLL